MGWKLGGLVSILMLAVACNGGTPASDDATVGTTASPIVLTQGIAASAPRKGLEQLMSADRDAVAREAIAYLHAQRDALAMRSPKDELSVIHAHVDELAMTHIRFNQVERGVRVDGGEFNAHFDRDGRMTSLTKHYVPNLAAFDVTPTIAAGDASATAIANRGKGSVLGTPELIVYARSPKQAPVLAWQIDIRASAAQRWFVYVDAETGAVFHTESRVHALAGAGVALDGQSHPVNFTLKGTTNELVDQTRASTLAYFDAKNSITDTSKIGVITSKKPTTTWDATSTLGPGSAVSAQQAIGATADYYLKTFQRNGWLGDSSEMDIILHQPDDDGTAGMDNAYYSPAPDNFIAIGDGKTLMHPLAQFVDVLAHEFTHGVTGSTANLGEDPESDALNESISDCFGAIVEHSVKPDPINNWLLGEGTIADGSANFLRSMANPEQSLGGAPSNMSAFVQPTDDDTGSHTNNGITNNAAYLATMGGTNAMSKIVVAGGIGWDNFAKVWYRADTVYLTATAQFTDMADATLKAAADLKLSDADVDTIDCAWKAVGVTQGACKQAAVTPQAVTPAATTTTSATTGDDDDSTAASAKSSSTPLEPLKSSSSAGCNATGQSSGETFALLLGALGLIAVRRRKRSISVW